MKMLTRAVLGLSLLTLAIGCGPADQGYAPPTLAGQTDSLVIDDNPMQRDDQRSGSYGDEGTYLGYVFQARAGESYDIALTRLSGATVPAIVIYRHEDTGFSEPLAWASADAATITLGGWHAPSAGTYLLMVDVVSGPRDGTFMVTIACTDGCADPIDCEADADCPAGQICYGGLCLDDEVECEASQDCPAGQVCERGFCVAVCTPGVEICDGVDNDCDGLIDEGCGDPCTSDADCPAGEFCDAATGVCQAACLCATDADCPEGAVCRDCACWPVCTPEAEICDGVDNDCDGLIDEGCGVPCATNADCAAGQVCANGLCVEEGLPCSSDADCAAGEVCMNGLCVSDTCQEDLDGDGFTCAVDCDDADAAIYPGAAEIADGLDNDCDGLVDEGGLPCASDADCAAGEMCQGGVCVPVCLPGIEECNGADDDCDGLIDEGCGTSCGADAECPPGMICQNGVCTDPGAPCASDADCAAGESCWNGLCIVACRTDQECPAGEVCVGGVCAAACVPAAELCDGLDNDCDGAIDEGCGTLCTSDADCAAGQVCMDGVCVEQGLPCAADADCPAGMACVAGLCQLACTDLDGDGFCSTEDCDDQDASVNPAASEACDGLDNNCDGEIDEGCSVACTSDADCAAGQMCLDGVCVVNSCRLDSDCPAGMVCVANVCELP